jgi:hypothetical protein
VVVAVEDALAELALDVVVVVVEDDEPPVPPVPELEELDGATETAPLGASSSSPTHPVPTRAKPKNTSQAMMAQPEQREAFMAQPFCQRQKRLDRLFCN